MDVLGNICCCYDIISAILYLIHTVMVSGICALGRLQLYLYISYVQVLWDFGSAVYVVCT